MLQRCFEDTMKLYPSCHLEIPLHSGLQDQSQQISFQRPTPGMNGQGRTMFSGSVRSSRRRAPRRVKFVASSILTFSEASLC